jgi:hypothetical protein
LVAMPSVLYRSMVGKQDREIRINSRGRPLIHENNIKRFFSGKKFALM